MNQSLAIARVLGTLLLLLSTSLLVNRKFVQKKFDDSLKMGLLVLLSGIISLIIGLITLELNSVWSLDFRLIITLIGWLFFINGAFRLLFPQKALKLATKFIYSRYSFIYHCILFTIGLFLDYVGLTALL